MFWFLFSTFIVLSAAGYLLQGLNIWHMRRHGHRVPKGFEQALDAEVLAKTSAYTWEHSLAGLVQSLFSKIVTAVFLFAGVIVPFDRFVTHLSDTFILSGLAFFLLLLLGETLLAAPFDLYSTFRIENRYGFNTTSGRLWLADQVKGLLISIVLTLALVASGLALVQWMPGWWWLPVWLLFFSVSILMLYIAPYLIEPLFNKFEPIKDQELAAKINQLAAQAGCEVSRILQVDASKRSRHSNAYFTGVGRVKRVVLYDTLLEQMDHDEILAVLAHELGHWKRHHIIKRLVAIEVFSLLACWATWWLLQWPGLIDLLQLEPVSFCGRLVIVGFLGSLLGLLYRPFGSWLSRRQERQADAFARQLTGAPQALASALVKMAKENLANLHPHPAYAAVYYSHPPLVDRVAQLNGP